MPVPTNPLFLVSAGVNLAIGLFYFARGDTVAGLGLMGYTVGAVFQAFQTIR